MRRRTGKVGDRLWRDHGQAGTSTGSGDGGRTDAGRPLIHTLAAAASRGTRAANIAAGNASQPSRSNDVASAPQPMECHLRPHCAVSPENTDGRS